MTDYTTVSFFRDRDAPGRRRTSTSTGCASRDRCGRSRASGCSWSPVTPRRWRCTATRPRSPSPTPSGTFSSCNAVSGPFVKFPEPFEGDDVTDLIVRYRHELPFSDQLPAFDPPMHTAHRHLLMRLITPKGLKENEDFMWEYADRLLDGFVDSGTCELVSAYAEPFTLTVIADLEGVPEEDHELFRDRLSTVHEQMEHKPLEFLYERFSQYIEERRRDPRDDILSGLATASFPDGSTPEVKDAALLAANLFAGGQETTVRMISFALRMLGERPDLQAKVRADRDLHPDLHRGDAAAREPAAHPVPHDPRAHGARRRRDPGRRHGDARSRARATATRACSSDPHDVRHRPRQRPPAHRLRPRHPHLRRRPARPRRGPRHRQPLPRPHRATSPSTSPQHGPADARRYDYLKTFFLRGLQQLHLELT